MFCKKFTDAFRVSIEDIFKYIAEGCLGDFWLRKKTAVILGPPILLSVVIAALIYIGLRPSPEHVKTSLTACSMMSVLVSRGPFSVRLF